jgi:hypothetical protein
MRIKLGFWTSPFPAVRNVLTAYHRMSSAQHQSEHPLLRLDMGPPDPIELEARSFGELESSLPFAQKEFERGLRFLEKTQSIAGIDQLLNSPEGLVEFPQDRVDWRRPAVLCAYMNKNPNFSEIANRVMRVSHEAINADHELFWRPRSTTIRSEESLVLLVEDLRNGILRNYELEGEHPSLMPPVDPIESRIEDEAHMKIFNARARADWIALHGDPANRGYGSSELEPAGSYLFGEVYASVQLSGFDADGEPSIRVYSEGHLVVVFEFMPPSAWEMDATDAGMLGNEMAEAIGLDMSEELRGFFLVANPAKDTIERITTFVSTYRQTHGYNP